MHASLLPVIHVVVGVLGKAWGRFVWWLSNYQIGKIGAWTSRHVVSYVCMYLFMDNYKNPQNICMLKP